MLVSYRFDIRFPTSVLQAPFGPPLAGVMLWCKKIERIRLHEIARIEGTLVFDGYTHWGRLTWSGRCKGTSLKLLLTLK